MSKENNSKTALFNKDHARRKRKAWIISLLSIAVISATVIALTLPAVTLSTICGLETHVHGDDCYEERIISGSRSIVCGFEDAECVVIHTHDEHCYDAAGNLICPLEEIEGHQHTDECYSSEKVLICGLEENPGHIHTEECYQNPRQLICGLEESEEHHHTEECYENPRALICGLEESEEHHHTEECYENPREPICGHEEGEGAHTHGNECYEEHTILICGKEELIAEAVLDYLENTASKNNYRVIEHQHNENCIHEEEPSVERVLICTIPEHIHSDDCYPDEGTFCGIKEHVHGPECFDENGELICQKSEHQHTDACYTDPSGEAKETPDPSDADPADAAFELECTADNGIVVIMRGQAASLPCSSEEIELMAKSLSYDASFGRIDELLEADGKEMISSFGVDISLYCGSESVRSSNIVELTFMNVSANAAANESVYVFGIDTESNDVRDMNARITEQGDAVIESVSVSRFEVVIAKEKEVVLSRGYGDHGTIETVDSRADGITLNLFNYYGYNLDTWDNKVTSPVYNGINSGRNVNNHLLFLGSGSEASTNGINHFTNGPIALQGIVNRTLTNGYPTLRTNNSSLDYLFNLTPNGNTKRVYADVNHLFRKDSNGYYRYDSDRNYAYYNSNTGGGDFIVYNDTYNNSDGTPIGFFPFNDYDTRYRNVKPDQPVHYDHHFGLTMTASFYMPLNGKVNGEDMIFDFSGDDDVWVFIDDVLVLDIGGLHETVHGKINFATGVVTVSGATPASCAGGTAIGTSNTIAAIFAAAGRTYDGSDYSEHTISFFYLERGGCYSNCSLSFNLSIFQTRALEIEKEIEGDDAEQVMDTEFRFRLYVGNGSDPDNYIVYTGPAYYSDGTPVAFSDDGVFILRAGQRIIAPDIPDYKQYYIEELDVDSNLFQEVKINGQVCQPVYSSSNDAMYTIYSSTTSIKDCMEIICTNVRPRPPRISVEKLWHDLYGNQINAPVDSISVELWRKYMSPEGGQSHTVDFQVLLYNSSTQQVSPYHISTAEVADGGSISFACAVWTGSSGATSTGGPVTQNGTYNFESWYTTPLYVRNTVVQNETVTILFSVNGNNNEWLYQEQLSSLRFRIVSLDEPQPPDPSAGSFVHELVDTVVLSDANGWKYQWPDTALPSEHSPGVPYYYYVREIGVEGFITTYSNNDGITAGVITITNTAQTVDLIIKKLVVGTLTEDSFSFRIVIQDADGNQITDIPSGNGYTVNDDGSVTFVLHDGEFVTISGLPLGATAVITETEHDGYIVLIKEGEQTLFTSDTGSVVLNGDREITFVNSAGAVLPETGGKGTKLYMLGGLAIMLIAVMYGIGRRIRERRAAV